MSVTAPLGFVASGVAAGIKPSGDLDLALVSAERRIPAAAVFTRNRAAAAPVWLSRRNLAEGAARAVVVNSGCANAATGPQGAADAEATVAAVAAGLGCDPAEVLVLSTGPIGPTLPMDSVIAGVGKAVAALGRDGGDDAAAAILTTDTVPKQARRHGDGYVVGAMAKGAAMVRPDMATMLSVITTDAAVESPALDASLRRAVEVSFNSLNIDGCMSTNDAVVMLASGESGVRPDDEAFEALVTDLCRELASQMVHDAEGATRVVTIEVSGAIDAAAARNVGLAIADSALVRASFYGGDPNWGRVLAAVGAGPEPAEPGRTTIAYAGTEVARAGAPVPFDEEALAERLQNGDFTVSVGVGEGSGHAEVMTCDLTPEYVRFNGERS